MFVGGEFGEFGLRTAGMTVPAWEHNLLTTAAALGIVIAAISPFVFGIVLPLTE